MKKFIVLLAALATVGVSKADILVNWIDFSGFTQADGVTPIAASGNVLAQLVFTSTGVQDLTGLAGDVRASQIMNTPTDIGNDYIAGFSFNYDATFETGFLYVRVFSDDVPGVGDFFYNGPTFATVDNAGGSSPREQVTTGAPAGGTGFGGTYRVDIPVVPEPSVLAFLGMGALAMAIRRRRA